MANCLSHVSVFLYMLLGPVTSGLYVFTVLQGMPVQFNKLKTHVQKTLLYLNSVRKSSIFVEVFFLKLSLYMKYPKK